MLLKIVDSNPQFPVVVKRIRVDWLIPYCFDKKDVQAMSDLRDVVVHLCLNMWMSEISEVRISIENQ